MKNTSILIATLLINLNLHSQKTEENLKLHAVDCGFGFFLTDNFGGLSIHSSMVLNNNSNLYSFSVIAGTELKILGGPTARFVEYNLQYGRQLKLANWLSFEGFAGIGYYIQDSSKSVVRDYRSLSLPFKINTRNPLGAII
jgi:hypothetical protein